MVSALFEEQDVLLQRDDRPAIRDFAELRGKTLGTSLGYVYADDLMQAFAAGEIRREDTRDLASRVQMLAFAPDAAVDMRRPLLYLTRQHPELGLSVSPLVLQSYRMHCIYGGQLPVPVESMDRVLDEMVRDGSIERLLENSLRTLRNPERAPPLGAGSSQRLLRLDGRASRQTLKASSSDCQRRTTQARTARSSSRPTPKMKSGTISTGEEIGQRRDHRSNAWRLSPRYSPRTQATSSSCSRRRSLFTSFRRERLLPQSTRRAPATGQETFRDPQVTTESSWCIHPSTSLKRLPPRLSGLSTHTVDNLNSPLPSARSPSLQAFRQIGHF